MMKRWLAVMGLTGITFLGGCSDTYQKLNTGVTSPVDSLISSGVGVAVIDAPLSDCPAGGSLIVSYRDLNGDGNMDLEEPRLSSAKVCNGVAGSNGSNGSDGSQGFGAGILVEVANSASCPAGGSVFKTFVDKNNNATLDGDETLSSLTTICSGVAGANGNNGSNGSDGQNGSDGKNAHLTVTLASGAQCPAGGYVYSSSIDGQPLPDETIVCNGQNGQNGTNGSNGSNGQDATFAMGSVGPMVPGHSYSVCHHDYLYIPDSVGGNRGWLTFRHQGNGSADQGIGATGFQIWNIDIADFSLVSEVGAVPYCNLHWDPNTKTLTYTDVDGSDGYSPSGTIQF